MSRVLKRVGPRRLAKWLAGLASPADLLRLDRQAKSDLLHGARLRLDAGRADEAERIYRLIQSLWPGSTDAALGLGACRQLAGDLDGAVALYDQVLAETPDDPFARANRAECALLAGRPEAAHADLATVDLASAPKALRDRLNALKTIVTASP